MKWSPTLNDSAHRQPPYLVQQVAVSAALQHLLKEHLPGWVFAVLVLDMWSLQVQQMCCSHATVHTYRDNEL